MAGRSQNAVLGHKQASWARFEPGYSVFEDEDLKAIIIKDNGVRIHLLFWVRNSSGSFATLAAIRHASLHKGLQQSI